MGKSKKADSVSVVVTDFGNVSIRPETEAAYIGHYFRKRAPVKSRKEALKRLEEAVMCMSDHFWVVGKVLEEV